MIEILLAAAIALGQNSTPGENIDAPFADLDRRYFTILVATNDALINALAEGPSEISAQTSTCLGLLTPLHRELDTKALRREMQLFSSVLPEDRAAVFELARTTARTQAANIQLRVQILESLEQNCQTISEYRLQRLHTMDLREDVSELLETVVNQPPTGAHLVE